ncbi:MAG: major capsid protein [Synechococcaceae cyanobacterium]
MGLTLIEVQKYTRRAEQLAVLKTFAKGELLRRLPFRNLLGVSLSFTAETKLLRVGFRAVNAGYRQSYGFINSDSEFVHLFRGDLDVDRSIVDLQGPEARAGQAKTKVRSMHLTLKTSIIIGDDTFDPRVFNGLSKRFVLREEQTIDNGGDAETAGAGSADLQSDQLRRRQGADRQQGRLPPDQHRLPPDRRRPLRGNRRPALFRGRQNPAGGGGRRWQRGARLQ